MSSYCIRASDEWRAWCRNVGATRDIVHNTVCPFIFSSFLFLYSLLATLSCAPTGNSDEDMPVLSHKIQIFIWRSWQKVTFKVKCEMVESTRRLWQFTIWQCVRVAGNCDGALGFFSVFVACMCVGDGDWNTGRLELTIKIEKGLHAWSFLRK